LQGLENLSLPVLSLSSGSVRENHSTTKNSQGHNPYSSATPVQHFCVPATLLVMARRDRRAESLYHLTENTLKKYYPHLARLMKNNLM